MSTKPISLIQVPNQRLFGTKAAAQYLGVHPDTLRKYADLGWIKARKLERRRVFSLEDLNAFINALPEYQSYDYTPLAENPVERRQGMGVNRVIKRGKPRIEVRKRWPDGTTFRRYMPNMTVAKQRINEIELAIAKGTWKSCSGNCKGHPKKRNSQSKVWAISTYGLLQSAKQGCGVQGERIESHQSHYR